MKTIFTILITAFVFASCFSAKEIQVERSSLQLKSIDTLYRAHGNFYRYTWYDIKNRLTYSEYRDEGDISGTAMEAIIRK